MANEAAPEKAVIKVGGSLFDLPDLGLRLRTWLGRQPSRRILLVTGGGHQADRVRRFDARHQLSPSTSHWLAVRAMLRNAQNLHRRLELPSAMVDAWTDCPRLWNQGIIAILNPCEFLRADEKEPESLPHSWDVTSDSISARVAVKGGASKLILLKRIEIPAGMGWAEAAAHGFVDPFFPQASKQTSHGSNQPLRVLTLDFRQLFPVQGRTKAEPARGPDWY
jgi:aspartokinase-like uncharacterized kinase